MYIIVAGGGKVGYYLAKELLSEGHEVLVIEQNPRKCEQITEELGSIAVRGDACETTTLSDAGTARADMVVAVTGDDEDNMVICQVAKKKFNVPRTIARINNPKNETIFKKLGIDVTVSSTTIILEHIGMELPTHPLVHLLELRAQGLEIVDIKITSTSPAAGKQLKDLSLPPNSVISLHLSQKHGPSIPQGDSVLEAGDAIIAVTTPENETLLKEMLAGR
ncbi:MAG: TrkA family potassium uptake protein [Dehalococcoidia bacterium]|nr:TrkA family potassium uptake protein [Dehalococcoidia bacterium]